MENEDKKEFPFPNISLKDIEEAAERIKPFVHKTPVMTCETLNKMGNKQFFFKCENFQKVVLGGTNFFRQGLSSCEVLSMECYPFPKTRLRREW